MARKGPYNFYAIVVGLEPGIYSEWEGPLGAKARVDGYSFQEYKGFNFIEEAIAWYKEKTGGKEPIMYIKKPTPKYFVITHGKQIGIYNCWFGDEGANSQILGVKRPLFKCFDDLQEATEWYKEKMGKEPTLRFKNEQE